MNIKYRVPVGSEVTRHFYCPILKEIVSLTNNFTEEEIVFNIEHLKRVDSGINCAYFRFTVSNEYPNGTIAPSKFDVQYSVSVKDVEIDKQLEVEWSYKVN